MHTSSVELYLLISLSFRENKDINHLKRPASQITAILKIQIYNTDYFLSLRISVTLCKKKHCS